MPEGEADFHPETPPTPQERNSELRTLIEMLPPESEDWLNRTLQEDEQQVERREQLELFTKYEQKLEGLLKDAPVTDSFRRFITQRTAPWYKLGTPKAPEFLASEFFFLDPDNPQSGGIFDQSLAKGFERQAFLNRIGNLAEHHW